MLGVLGMMVTHVDDLMWAVFPEEKHHVDAILKDFVVNNEKT